VAFSPDGKQVLTGSLDGKARLWDAATGRLRREWSHPEAVRAVAFSPDGRQVLTGCDDHTARLWDAATGRRLGAPLAHRHPVWAVAFHPSRPLLITGGGSFDFPYGRYGQGEAQVWDAVATKPVGPPLPATSPILSVAFSPDGGRVATASRDGQARLTDVSRLSPLALTVRHGPGVRWARFRPDGRALLTVAGPTPGKETEGELRLWDADTGRALGRPLPTRSSVDSRNVPQFRVEFSPDGRVLVNHLPGGALLLRSAATGRPLGPPGPAGVAVGHTAGLSPAGKLFYVLRDGAAVLWDTASDKQAGPPLTHEGGVTAAAFRPDGQALLTAGGDGTVCLWDLATRRRLAGPLRHPSPVRALAFSPDGGMFLTADRENTLRRWETRTGRPVGAPLPDPDPAHPLHHLYFTADGRHFVKDSGWFWCLWSAETGAPVAVLDGIGHVWGRGGQMLALVEGDAFEGQDGAVRLWDVRRRERRGVPTVTNGWSLAFHPDGQILAAGGEQAAGLWDVTTRKPIGPPLHHPSPLLGVTFAPDGRRLLTCCGDDTARVWEVPAPVGGRAERVRLWVEVLTGWELDEARAARPISETELKRRRARLEELDGPPLP
jgi:WD40 repeat protein